MTTVGIVANAESGRDVRRLVTGATVHDNAEKAAAVARLVAGAAVEGVQRILVMPTSGSLIGPLDRRIRQLRRTSPVPIPEVEVLDFRPRLDADDTTRATAEMVARGCTALGVLGGDGTHRLVAAACGDIPILALSTGTNNAFPRRYEETTAGRALGLIATGRVSVDDGCLRERAIRLTTDTWRELALVDVAVVRQRFVGAKAVWLPEDLQEIVVVFSDPTVIGLSAIASELGDFQRGVTRGLRIRLAGPGEEGRPVLAALAPGTFSQVRVADVTPLELNQTVELRVGAGSLALDGERTVEASAGTVVSLRLEDGPLTIDPLRCLLAHAATERVSSAARSLAHV